MMHSRKSYLFVVHRNRAEIFATLSQRLERPCRLHVIWDRRLGERRVRWQPVGVDRRKAERRGRPAVTWLTLGFVLVPPPAGP